MSFAWLDWLIEPPVAVDVFLKASVFLALAWMAHAAFGRANSRWRVLLWRGVAIGLVAMPLAMSLMPAIRIRIAKPQPRPQVVNPVPIMPGVLERVVPGAFDPPAGSWVEPLARPDARIAVPPFDATGQSVRRSSPEPPVPSKPGFVVRVWRRENLPLFLGGVWFAAVVILAFRLQLGARWVRRIVANSRGAPREVVDECRRVSRRLGCPRTPQVRIAADLSTPFLTGIRRPVLLLPRRMCRAAYQAELPAIMAHELSHLRTHDVLWSCIIHWLAILLWFHPLVWRIRGAHAAACEQVSDAVSADFVGDVGAYSRTLARVATDLVAAPPTAAGIPMARVSAIRRRLQRLKHRVSAMPLRRRSVAIACLGAVLAVGTVGALRLVYAASDGDAKKRSANKILGPRSAEDAFPPEIQQQLDDAIGYAVVFNCEKVDELCDRVLSMTQDGDARAHAHWVKAFAYANFMTEYRTDRLKAQYEAEKQAALRLKPALFADLLAVKEVLMRIYSHERADVESIVADLRRELFPDFPADQPLPLDNKAIASDPVRLYQMGQAYLQAADFALGQQDGKYKEHYERGARLLKKAAELRPTSYEYAAYYATAVFRTKRYDEAETVARELVARFGDRNKYPFTIDRGPYSLFLAVLAHSNPQQYEETVERHAASPNADAWSHFEYAGFRSLRASSHNEKVAIWRELARRIEEGDVRTPGTQLRARTKVYYYLAHLVSFPAARTEPKAAARALFEDSLAIYNKLAEISPHYAELHFNKGLCLQFLRYLETLGSDRQKQLFEEAKKEFELQTQYNWHGDGAEQARRALEKLVRPEGPLPPSHAAPTDVVERAEREFKRQQLSEAPDYSLVIDLASQVLATTNRPARARAHFLLAQIEKNNGNTDKALDLLEQALIGSSTLPGAYSLQGDLLFDKGEFARARLSYLKALQRDPKDAHIDLQLGKIHRLEGDLLFGKGDYERARLSYLAAIHRDPKDTHSYLRLAKICQNHLKAYSEALEHYHLYLKYGGTERRSVVGWMEECDRALGRTVPDQGRTVTRSELQPARDALKQLIAEGGELHAPLQVQRVRGLIDQAERAPYKPDYDPSEIQALVDQAVNDAEDGIIESKKKKCLQAIELIQRALTQAKQLDAENSIPGRWKTCGDDFAEFMETFWRKEYDNVLSTAPRLEAQVSAMTARAWAVGGGGETQGATKVVDDLEAAAEALGQIYGESGETHARSHVGRARDLIGQAATTLTSRWSDPAKAGELAAEALREARAGLTEANEKRCELLIESIQNLLEEARKQKAEDRFPDLWNTCNEELAEMVKTFWRKDYAAVTVMHGHLEAQVARMMTPTGQRDQNRQRCETQIAKIWNLLLHAWRVNAETATPDLWKRCNDDFAKMKEMFLREEYDAILEMHGPLLARISGMIQAASAATQDQQDRLVELIHRLCDARDRHPKIRLTFLDWRWLPSTVLNTPNGEGWDVPRQLPPNLSGSQIWDTVDKLRVTALEMQHLTDPLQKKMKRVEYNNYLGNLGIEASRFDAIRQQGDLAFLVKKLAHARLIWERKNRDQQRGIVASIQKLEQLYEILEIQLPKDREILPRAIAQVQFLLDLINSAEKQGIPEIRSVHFQPLPDMGDFLNSIRIPAASMRAVRHPAAAPPPEPEHPSFGEAIRVVFAGRPGVARPFADSFSPVPYEFHIEDTVETVRPDADGNVLTILTYAPKNGQAAGSVAAPGRTRIDAAAVGLATRGDALDFSKVLGREALLRGTDATHYSFYFRAGDELAGIHALNELRFSTDELELRCDELVYQRNPKGQAIAATATSNSVVSITFRLEDADGKREETRATCGRFEYFPDEKRIILTGKPVLHSRDDNGRESSVSADNITIEQNENGQWDVRVVGPPSGKAPAEPPTPMKDASVTTALPNSARSLPVTEARPNATESSAVRDVSAIFGPESFIQTAKNGEFILRTGRDGRPATLRVVKDVRLRTKDFSIRCDELLFTSSPRTLVATADADGIVYLVLPKKDDGTSPSQMRVAARRLEYAMDEDRFTLSDGVVMETDRGDGDITQVTAATATIEGPERGSVKFGGNPSIWNLSKSDLSSPTAGSEDPAQRMARALEEARDRPRKKQETEQERRREAEREHIKRETERLFLRCNTLRDYAVRLLEMAEPTTGQQPRISEDDLRKGAKTVFAEAGAIVRARANLLQRIGERPADVPNLAEVYRLCGRLHMSLQQAKEAKEDYLGAIRENPNDVEAYRLLARYHQFFNEYNKAKERYLKAIELEPTHAETYRQLGILCQNDLKTYEEAIKYFQLYLEHGGAEAETVRRWFEECRRSLENELEAAKGKFLIVLPPDEEKRITDMLGPNSRLLTADSVEIVRDDNGRAKELRAAGAVGLVTQDVSFWCHEFTCYLTSGTLMATGQTGMPVQLAFRSPIQGRATCGRYDFFAGTRRHLLLHDPRLRIRGENGDEVAPSGGILSIDSDPAGRPRVRVDETPVVEVATPPASDRGPPERPIAVDRLVWGEPVNGLRAALELAPDLTTYTLPAGIGVRFHVQNVSTQTIWLKSEHWRTNDPATITHESGEIMAKGPVEVDYNHWVTYADYRLVPGQTVALESEGLTLARDQTQVALGEFYYCKPGRNTIQYTLSFHGPGWKGSVKTGPRHVDILPQEGVDPGPAARATTLEIKTAEGVVAIPWGKPVNGLRSAVELTPEKRSYGFGESIGVQYHIQNVTTHPVFIAGHAQSKEEQALVLEDATGRAIEALVKTDDPEGGKPTPPCAVGIQPTSIAPGKTVVIGATGFALAANDSEAEQILSNRQSPVGHHVFQCRPGRYTLRPRPELANWFPDSVVVGSGGREITVTDSRKGQSITNPKTNPSPNASDDSPSDRLKPGPAAVAPENPSISQAAAGGSHLLVPLELVLEGNPNHEDPNTTIPLTGETPWIRVKGLKFLTVVRPKDGVGPNGIALSNRTGPMVWNVQLLFDWKSEQIAGIQGRLTLYDAEGTTIVSTGAFASLHVQGMTSILPPPKAPPGMTFDVHWTDFEKVDRFKLELNVLKITIDVSDWQTITSGSTTILVPPAGDHWPLAQGQPVVLKDGESIGIGGVTTTRKTDATADPYAPREIVLEGVLNAQKPDTLLPLQAQTSWIDVKGLQFMNAMPPPRDPSIARNPRPAEVRLLFAWKTEKIDGIRAELVLTDAGGGELASLSGSTAPPKPSAIVWPVADDDLGQARGFKIRLRVDAPQATFDPDTYYDGLGAPENVVAVFPAPEFKLASRPVLQIGKWGFVFKDAAVTMAGGPAEAVWEISVPVAVEGQPVPTFRGELTMTNGDRWFYDMKGTPDAEPWPDAREGAWPTYTLTARVGIHLLDRIKQFAVFVRRDRRAAADPAAAPNPAVLDPVSLKEALEAADKAFFAAYRVDLVAHHPGELSLRHGPTTSTVKITGDGKVQALVRETLDVEQAALAASPPPGQSRTVDTHEFMHLGEAQWTWRKDSVGFQVIDDNRIAQRLERAPMIKTYSPGHKDAGSLFYRYHQCLGRGFAQLIDEITTVTVDTEGIAHATAKGRCFTAYDGVWQLEIDTQHGYLVRGAAFGSAGKPPSVVFRSEGAWDAAATLARRGAFGIEAPSGNLTVLEVLPQAYSRGGDASLIDAAAAAFRGDPRPRTTSETYLAGLASNSTRDGPTSEPRPARRSMIRAAGRMLERAISPPPPQRMTPIPRPLISEAARPPESADVTPVATSEDWDTALDKIAADKAKALKKAKKVYTLDELHDRYGEFSFPPEFFAAYDTPVQRVGNPHAIGTTSMGKATVFAQAVRRGDAAADRAARAAMDSPDPERRALGMLLWAQRFDPARIEVVAGFLDDDGECHVPFVEPAQQVRSAAENVPDLWCKATVGFVARYALEDLTNFRPASADVFRRWWAANKDYEQRLWYWSRKWGEGAIPEGDIERVMAVNPKEGGLDILLYVNEMEAREWEAADSLGLDRGEFQKVMSMRHHHASKPPAEQVARIIKDNPFLEERFEELIVEHRIAFGQDGLANDFYRRLAPVAAQLYKGRELEFFDRFRRANDARPWLGANLLVHLADGIASPTRRALTIEYVRKADKVIYQPLLLRLVRAPGWDDAKTGALMGYYKKIERANHDRAEIIRAVGEQGKPAWSFLVRLWRLEPLTLFDENRERWDAAEEAFRVAAFLDAFNRSAGHAIFTEEEIRSLRWTGKISSQEIEARRTAAKKIWPSVKKRIDALLAEPSAPGGEISKAEPKSRKTPPDLVWGPKVKGLRAAVEFVPEQTSYTIGQKIEPRFHVQNVSLRPIRLTAKEWHDQYSLDMKGLDGPDARGGTVVGYSGIEAKETHLLLPREKVALKSSAFALVDGWPLPDEIFDSPPLLHTGIPGQPGRYSAQFKISFPWDGWNGELPTGPRELVFTSQSSLEFPGRLSRPEEARKSGWKGVLETGAREVVVLAERANVAPVEIRSMDLQTSDSDSFVAADPANDLSSLLGRGSRINCVDDKDFKLPRNARGEIQSFRATGTVRLGTRDFSLRCNDLTYNQDTRSFTAASTEPPYVRFNYQDDNNERPRITCRRIAFRAGEKRWRLSDALVYPRGGRGEEGIRLTGRVLVIDKTDAGDWRMTTMPDPNLLRSQTFVSRLLPSPNVQRMEPIPRPLVCDADKSDDPGQPAPPPDEFPENWDLALDEILAAKAEAARQAGRFLTPAEIAGRRGFDPNGRAADGWSWQKKIVEFAHAVARGDEAADQAAGNAVENPDPEKRALGLLLWAQSFDPSRIERVADLLDDAGECHILFADVWPQKIPPKGYAVLWSKAPVGFAAQYAVEELTGFRPASADVFGTWWAVNKDYEKRLWYWSRKWMSGIPEGDVERVMAVNPKERGLEILLYVKNREAREYEARTSLGVDRGEFQKNMSQIHYDTSEPPAEQVARIIKDNPFLEQRFEDLIVAHKGAFGQDGLATDFYQRLLPVAAELYKGRELDFFLRFRQANDGRPWLVANMLDRLADGIEPQTRRPFMIEYVRKADKVIYQPLALRLVREPGWDDEKTDALTGYYRKINRAHRDCTELAKAAGEQGKAALPFLIQLWKLEPLTLFDENLDRWVAAEEASRVAAFLEVFNQATGRKIFTDAEIRAFHWMGKLSSREAKARRTAARRIWPSVLKRIENVIASAESARRPFVGEVAKQPESASVAPARRTRDWNADLDGLVAEIGRAAQKAGKAYTLADLQNRYRGTSFPTDLYAAGGGWMDKLTEILNAIRRGDEAADRAARAAMDSSDPEKRALAVLLWARRFEPARIEVVAKFLDDEGECHVPFIEPMQQAWSPAVEIPVAWCKATVGFVARYALEDLTNFRPASADVFRRWWAVNKDYEQRLWYWSRKWGEGAIPEGDIERVMAVNPKERGLDILFYVNEMEAREWEAAHSLGLDRGEFQKVMSMRHHHASKPPAEQVARIIKDNPFLEERFEELIVEHRIAFGQDGLANDFYRRLAPVAAQLYKGRELEFFDRFRRANDARPWLGANLLVHLADGIASPTRRALTIEYVRKADKVIYQPLVLRLVREGGWDDEKTDALMEYYKKIERASHGRSAVIRAVGAQGQAALPFLIRLWRLEPQTLFDKDRQRWDTTDEAYRITACLEAFNQATGRKIFTDDEIRSFRWMGKISSEEFEARRTAAKKAWPSILTRIENVIDNNGPTEQPSRL